MELPTVTENTPVRQISASKWTQRTAQRVDWTPRSLHACINWVDHGVFILGGFNGNNTHGDLADVWLLPKNATDDASLRQPWHQVTPGSGFSPRHGLSVALWRHPQLESQPKVLIVTGGTGGGSPLPAGLPELSGHHGGAFFGDFWSSLDGIQWNPESALFPGRSGHKMVALENQDLVLIGGISGGLILNDIWCMGPNCEMKVEDSVSSSNCRETWCRVVQQAAWEPREDAAVSVVPIKFRGKPTEGIIFCGGLGPNQAYNDVWFSSDGGGAWTGLTRKAPWSPRRGHGLVVTTGSQVVLMGGTNGGNFMSDIWVSVDAGASWSMIAETSPWSPRANHCVVRTVKGAMLIGGYDGDNDLSDVWSVQFDLADATTSTWISPLIGAAFVFFLDFQ